jgi:transcriptional repressor NrdR
VRCPQCASVDDKVVDSRTSDEGAAIRRRRECLACGRRFTTYERLEEAPFIVVKRSGLRQPFDRVKLIDGVRAAAKNRPVDLRAMEVLAGEVEESLRMEGPEISTQDVGRAVLERLRLLDDVTYLRFASVYKDFRDVEDFRREVGDLIKETAPKS